MYMRHMDDEMFTDERRFVDKHVFGRFVIEQHWILLDAALDRRDRLAHFIGQPSQSTSHHAKRYGLGEQPDLSTVLIHERRQLGNTSGEFGQERHPFDSHVATTVHVYTSHSASRRDK